MDYRDNIITMEQYKQMKNVCFDNLHDSTKLEDDIDHIYAEILYLHEQEHSTLKDICKLFSNIVVYEKDFVKFDVNFIYDYFSDNYSVESYDELEGYDDLEKAVELFNSRQTNYISSRPIAIMDCSKELYDYIYEECHGTIVS